MSEPMKDRPPGYKPRVFKLTAGGLWCADVKAAGSGAYLCEVFYKYNQALEQAAKYAAMNKEPTA